MTIDVRDMFYGGTEKRAQLASTLGYLATLGAGAYMYSNHANNARRQLADYDRRTNYGTETILPGHKDSNVLGLAGLIGGGLVNAYLNRTRRHDPDEDDKKSLIRDVITGALLGGVGGYGIGSL